ncbi:Acid protease [Mycena chlorophos]|uniref:Acid protease n=1 Tax=Mycena chlorophos TaxID=658473 RepID=A0A8H6WG02_MYCCL|nr:Acid protease [Mycena chlorophos]
MQLLTLISLALFALSSDARPVRARQPSTSHLVTVPVRRVQRDTGLHVELRHEQQINRAQRLAARAAGLPAPSLDELRANIERRASFIDQPETRKRFNIPPPGFGSTSLGTESFIQDDDTAAPTIAQFSSEVDPDGADTTFVVTLQLGTPRRNFDVILDSGSGDFWVDSDQCSNNGAGCGNHTFLGPNESSSLVRLNKGFSIEYGSGSAAGEVVNDTIVLGGMLIDNFTFGVAHNISDSFANDPLADGLMGLSKPSLSTQGVPPAPIVMRDVGFFHQAIVSYRLPRSLDHVNNGEVTFGGLDPAKFDPSTLVTINSTDSGFWIIPLEGASVNGNAVTLNSTQALMDTGTTLLVLPTADAIAVHAQIPGAQQQQSGQFNIPCNTTASVSVRFGGNDFEISPEDLLFASGGRTTGDCTSGIGSFNQPGNQWLVGDTFLKSVYFSTNFDENTVSLAKAV